MSVRRKILCFFVSLVLLIIGYVLFVEKAAHSSLRDFQYYRSAAIALESGKNPYQENLKDGHTTYLYPPTVAVLASLIEADSKQATHYRWCLINFLFLIFSALLLSLCGARLSGSHALVLFPISLFLLIGFEPTASTIAEGQVNLWILAALLLHLLFLLFNRRFLSGTALGVAAMVKVSPLLLAVPFIMRRDKAAICGLIVGVVCVFALCYLLEPHSMMILWQYVQSLPTLIQEEFISGKPSNLSLHGVFARNLPGSGFWITVLTISSIIAIVLFALRIKDRQRESNALLFCFSVVALFFFTPVLWSHHLVWIIPVLFLLGAIKFHRETKEHFFAHVVFLLLAYGALGFASRYLWFALSFGYVAGELVKVSVNLLLIALGGILWRELSASHNSRLP